MKTNIKILILFLAITGKTGAQEILSLENTRKMAIENSHNVKIAGKTMEKAEAESKAMRTMYLPSVSGSATMAYLSNEFNEELYLPSFKPDPLTGQLVPDIFIHPVTGMPVYGPDGNPIFNSYAYLPLELSLKGAYMAGINVQQPIFTGGKIVTGNKMAKLGKQMAEENLTLQHMNTIAEADQAYWVYVSVREKVKLAGQAVTMLDSLVQRVRHGVETGLVHQNELLKVQVKYNNATLDLQKAKSGLELSRMSLCRVVGLPFETKIVVTDTVIEYTPNLLLDFGAEDISQRPEYALLSKQVTMEEEQIKLKRADFLPTLGLSAGYSYLGGIKFGDNTLSSDGFNVMASLKIPLFHWGEGKHKIASAQLTREMKQLELEKNSQLLQLETEQAKLNLQDALLRIRICENALQQTAENLKLSQNRYEFGAELMTDLLIAQTQWQEAYSNLIEAKTDFKLKETNYLRVTGKLK
jgi:outer membrane protein TolC